MSNGLTARALSLPVPFWLDFRSYASGTKTTLCCFLFHIARPTTCRMKLLASLPAVLFWLDLLSYHAVSLAAHPEKEMQGKIRLDGGAVACSVFAKC